MDIISHGAEKPIDVDVSLHFRACGIQEHVRGLANKWTYAVDPDPLGNWFLYAVRAFQTWQRRIDNQHGHVDTFATIGTGPGWDAVGAYHAFRCGRIIATDSERRVINIARHNILGNTCLTPQEVLTDEGDICEPLRRHGIHKVDVAFANLPVLEGDNDQVEQPQGQASFTSTAQMTHVPTRWRKNGNAMNWRFVDEIRPHLHQGGVAMIIYGARREMRDVPDLFEACGLESFELHADFKVQSQYDVVVPEFAEIEKRQDIKIKFYEVEPSRKVLQEQKVKHGATIMEELLAPYRLSAAEALSKFPPHLETSIGKVGHIVRVVAGRKS
jgi:hypothetical protein